MSEVAIHSIAKHKELQLKGVPCLRIERKWGSNYHVFIYEKTEAVVEVLNANKRNI